MATVCLLPRGPLDRPRPVGDGTEVSYFPTPKDVRDNKSVILKEAIGDDVFLNSLFNGQITLSDGQSIPLFPSGSTDVIDEIKNEVILSKINAIIDEYSSLTDDAKDKILTLTNNELYKAHINKSSPQFKALLVSYYPEEVRRVFETNNDAVSSVLQNNFMPFEEELTSRSPSFCSTQPTIISPSVSSLREGAVFEVSFDYDHYPGTPFTELDNSWEANLTAPRVQRLNISGAGLKCGYFSLAMNIAQFSQEQRKEIYIKLELGSAVVDQLEKNRLPSLIENRSNSVYQQQLGNILFDRYQSQYGENIQFQDLVAIAESLGISLIIVKSTNQFYENKHLSKSVGVDFNQIFKKCNETLDSTHKLTTSDKDRITDVLRFSEIIDSDGGVDRFTLKDSKDNMIRKIDKALDQYKFTRKKDLSAQNIVDAIFYLYMNFLDSQRPLAVVYNMNGSELGGHYEAPRDLRSLLFVDST